MSQQIQKQKLSFDVFKKHKSIKPLFIFGLITLILTNGFLLFYLYHPSSNNNIELEPFRVNFIQVNNPNNNDSQSLINYGITNQHICILSFLKSDLYPSNYKNIQITSLILNTTIDSIYFNQLIYIYTINIGWDSTFITYNIIKNNLFFYNFYYQTSLQTIELDLNLLNYLTLTAFNFGIAIESELDIPIDESQIQLSIQFDAISININYYVLFGYISLMILGLYLIITSLSYRKSIKNIDVSPYVFDSPSNRKKI